MNQYGGSYRFRVACCVAFVFLLASSTFAQNVAEIGSGTGIACDTGISIAVSLTNEVPVRSFEFWVEFDDSILVATRVEPASRTADFQFSWFVQTGSYLWFEGIAPLQEPLAPGDGPIAHLVFNVDCDAQVDEFTTIRFLTDSCVVLDTLGNPLSGIEYRDGIFTVETGIWSEPFPLQSFAQPYAQVHPNPFRGTTVIGFALPSSRDGSTVTIDIFDYTGRWVTGAKIPVQNGQGSFHWGGTDSEGLLVPTGVYICTIRSVDADVLVERVSTRLILLR